MIRQRISIKGVFGVNAKVAHDLIVLCLNDGESRGDHDSSEVKEDMMFGAETEHVGEDIGTVVRLTERPDVGRFAIGSTCCLEADATDLAAVVMEALDVLRDDGVADDALPRDGPSGRSTSARRGGWCRLRSVIRLGHLIDEPL